MDGTIDRLLLDRQGVVLRRELRALGVSYRAIARGIEEGVWRSSGRSALVHSSAPPGLRTNTLVASVRNRDAVLTGTSATLLRPHPVWSGRTFRDTRAMLIAAHHRRGPWLTVQHPGAVWDNVNGIAVADLHTTLVDLLRFLPWSDAAAIAGSANQCHLTRNDMLAASVAALRKHPGAPQLRRLVQAMADGAESGPEIDLHIALRRAGIRCWVANPTLDLAGEEFRPDVAFMSQRVALEYDGIEEHSTVAAFHDDRQRDTKFQFRQDWQVVRLTSWTLYNEAALKSLFADLRVELRRRGCTDTRRLPR